MWTTFQTSFTNYISLGSVRVCKLAWIPCSGPWDLNMRYITQYLPDLSFVTVFRF